MIWPLVPATAEGVLARMCGEGRTDNPYDVSNASERHDAWLWGWYFSERWLRLNVDHCAATWWNADENDAV